MTGSAVLGLTKQQKSKLTAQLDKWQQELVNLTKRNKLLHFKHAKTGSLEIISPSMSEAAARLDSVGWSFYLPPTSEDDEDDDDTERDFLSRRRPDQLLTSRRSAREVLSALRALERTSNQTMLDTGIWVLYMAFGMLKWVDPSDNVSYESPLLLRPVRLERPGQPTEFRIVPTDDDVVINPALSLKLANDFDVTLPTLEDVDGAPSSVVGAVRRAIAKQRGWEVEERVVLTTFTFHKEAMYRDLLSNRALIEAHDLVQLVAVGPEAGAERFSFQPPDDDGLEEVAPPESFVSIRDADSTQRKCILAARDGRSFVMDGPPGTGKSQTIANIIAELLHAGRSVLFVSEKAAALEVVANRLEEAGLSEFVLEMHSHKATRKEVAVELGRALSTSARAQSNFRETDRANLVRLRKELNDYAIAANVQRRPLGQSLHQIIGQIVKLQQAPQGPVASAVDVSLTPEWLAAVLDAAERLGRAWRPVELGERFLWRSLRNSTFSAARQHEIAQLVKDCAAAVAVLTEHVVELDVQLGLGWASSLRDASRLQHLISTVEALPISDRAPCDWLVTSAINDLRGLLDSRKAQVDALHEMQTVGQRLADASWSSLPRGAGSDQRSAVEALIVGNIRLRRDGVEQFDEDALRNVANLVEEGRRRIAALQENGEIIRQEFGLSASSLTVDRCVELAELATLIGSATPPEANWLSPFAQATIVEAAAMLKRLVEDYRRREDALRNTFTESVLDLDLVGLRARMSSSSGLKKLGGTYRSDKKALAACVVGGSVTPAVIERLDEAIVWGELRNLLRSAEGTHFAVLGTYYQGVSGTDLDRLDRALKVAQRAVELCGPSMPSDLVRQISRDGSPSAEAVAAGQRLRVLTEGWIAETRPSLDALGVNDSTQTLVQLDEWLVEAMPHIESLLAVTAAMGVALRKPVTVGEVVELLELVDRVAEAEEVLNESYVSDAELLGASWDGASTDFSTLTRQLGWAEAVRAAFGGPLESHAAEALVEAESASVVLAQHLSDVTKAWSAIADLFEQPWRDRLTADFEVSFVDGEGLLGELIDTVADIEEWSRFATARQDLSDRGLGPVLDFLERGAVAAGDVALVVERSVLEAWADQVIATDPRLQTLAPTERDKLVEQFRRLDRELVANAAATIVNVCAARRPSTTLGAAGTIRREAQKKTRHKPIRMLLEETREVALALKPCFMMSPLSVSQYLPPVAAFDVVIFDEASQVKPSDAINCIYRGRQLIVAGDPRQLPPTNFFEQAAEEGSDDFDEEAPEDFESVLDICLGSGLPVLPLQWHYRSQHEALITYSNYRFYEGKLHTFPGAVEEAPDVGVALVPAGGIYRRGAGRDNPVEAAKVVERVLFHRRTHPHLTVGVVAFSSAQESAIVAELDRQRDREPEIAELLSDASRLDGFFVKNLENVQGDERDIIIFSIGYGPDENGKFTEQLGPLGQKGGERRLNVAITRARRRVEVVTSINAGSFPGTSSAPGIRHLQQYLDFAENGMRALAREVTPSDGDAESVFEEAVLRCVERFGYSAVPQVGVAGFRIDIGVRHPTRPGEFVLGVECDGAAYHSSRVARDRDRLRQEILEGLGWRIHRIWGPSWFRDRVGQEAALKAVIEAAISGRSVAPPSPLVGIDRPSVVTETVDLDSLLPEWSEVYTVCAWTPRSWFDSNEVHAVPTSDLVQGIVRIVEDEGPVHEDLLRRRLAEAYDVKRIGDRIKSAFDKAITMAIRQKIVERTERLFLQIPGTAVTVRTPNEYDDKTKRTVSQVSSAERQLAIVSLVEGSRRVSREDLRVAFGRLFGWRRVGVDIEAAFNRDVSALVKSGELSVDGDFLVVR